MPNIVEVVVRAVDDTKKGFAAAESSSTSLSKKLQKIGMIGGLALGAVAVGSIKMAAQFQSSMMLLQTQAGVSQKKLGELSKGVLDLAGQVGWSPNSLAASAYHVASNMQSMGATSTQMLKAVKIAAEGATVGHADLVDVTNALTAAIASGIPGVQNYSKAMGTLNAIVGTGDMSMENLAQAMGTGMLAVVKGYGLNIKDVGAALATFGDNNIRGAQAATYLRMAVQALAVPSGAGIKLLETWGYTSQTLAKDMQHGGLLNALEDLQRMFVKNGVTAKQQGEVITTLFGKRAGAGIAVLMGQMDRLKSKYPDLTRGANKFGDAWAQTQETASAKLKKLQGSFDTLAIELGNKLLPSATRLLNWMASHQGVVINFAVAIGGLTAALTAYSVAAKVAAVTSNPLALAIAAAAAALVGLDKIRDKNNKGSLLLPQSGDLGINGQWAHDIEHWLNVGLGKIDKFRMMDQAIMNNVRHGISNTFDGIRHDVSSVWDNVWNNTGGRFERFRKADMGAMDDLRHGIAGRFDSVRHDIAVSWDSTWAATSNRARAGANAVMNWIGALPGRIRGAFVGSAHWLTNQGAWIIQGLGSGIKSAWNVVANFFKGIPKAILNFLGIHSPPAWAIDAGKHIMNGLHIGMKAGGGTLGGFNKSNVFGQLSGGIMGGASGGVKRWAPLILKALSMLGEPLGDLGAVEHRMMQESGGNPRAINLTDSNAAAGDPSRGLMQTIGSTFNAYAGPFRQLGIYNPFANIYAGLNYAKHAYPGRSLASVMMQPGGYAAGGPAQGWIHVGEHGRELIRVPHGSHVYSNADSESMMAKGGGSGGGHMTIGLAPGTSDSKLMKEIIKQLRVVVFDSGGNVQDVLGWRS
jgi:TP901 family phage tail tape measure protein